MSEPLQHVVGQRLRAHRQRLGLSQEKLADQLGYLGSVERGERNLTLVSLEQLAERLGVDPLDLLRP